VDISYIHASDYFLLYQSKTWKDERGTGSKDDSDHRTRQSLKRPKDIRKKANKDSVGTSFLVEHLNNTSGVSHMSILSYQTI